MQALKPSIRELDGSALINVQADLSVSTVNLPTDGVFGRKNMLNLLPTDKLSDLIDKIATHLEDITTTPSLDDINISMSLYQAKSSMDGVIRTVIDNQKPETNLTDYIYYDNGGTLTAIITYADNSVDMLNRTLVNTSQKVDQILPIPPLNNLGITPYINIVNDDNVNLYKIRLYMGGNPSALYVFNAGPSVFSYQLKHVNTALFTRLTNVINFSVDNPTTPAINVLNPTYGIMTANTYTYVSGIPALRQNNTLTVSFQSINCVRAYYHKDYVASTYSPVLGVIDESLYTISFVPNPPNPPYPQLGLISTGGATNTNYIFTEIVVIKADKFVNSTDVDIYAKVQNSKGVSVSAKLLSSNGFNILIDSKSNMNKSATFINEVFNSNEINRVTSGTGLFPLLINFGSAFVSNTDLSTTKELILFNKTYQYLNMDFTNYFIPGPNYSSLAADAVIYDGTPMNVRWVTFSKSFDLNFNSVKFNIHTDDSSSWVAPDNVLITNVLIFITVRNGLVSSPWLDCNKSNLNPLNEGDGCLDIVNSTKFSKKCICSSSSKNPVQGTVYIRIGIIEGSGVTLTGVSF